MKLVRRSVEKNNLRPYSILTRSSLSSGSSFNCAMYANFSKRVDHIIVSIASVSNEISVVFIIRRSEKQQFLELETKG